MRGLVRSEIRRLASRRAVRVIGILVVAGILFGGLSQFLASEPGVAGARARAEQEVERCREQERRFREFQGPSDEGVQPIGPQCPHVEDLVLAFDQRFRLAEEMPSITRGVALALMVVAFVLGASLAGAEWGSAYMTPLLTWEPRRWAILAGKVVGVGLALGLAAFAGLVLLTATQYPSGVFRGTTAGADGSFWWSLVGLWGKGAALAALWAVAGVALATITRNTGAAIAIGLVYGAILDPVLTAWREWLAPWLLQRNLFHVLGFPVYAPQELSSPMGPSGVMVEVEAPALAITLGQLCLYLAAVVLVAYAAFRARDVT